MTRQILTITIKIRLCCLWSGHLKLPTFFALSLYNDHTYSCLHTKKRHLNFQFVRSNSPPLTITKESSFPCLGYTILISSLNENKIPEDSFSLPPDLFCILSPHFLATSKCKTEHIHWRKQSLIIKANRTEFAYVRFPTLNLETMSRELICCLWKKSVS